MRRIGFLVDQTLLEKEGRILSANVFHEFLMGFRAHFDELVLIARVFDNLEDFAASLPADPKDLETPYGVPDEVRVVRLPAYPNIASLFMGHARSWPEINRTLKKVLPDLDALWLNFGHPVSLRALQLCAPHEKIRCVSVLRGFYARDAKMRRKNSLVGTAAGATMKLLMNRFGKLANKRQVPCVAFGAEAERFLQGFGLRTISTRSSLLTHEAIAQAEGKEDPDLAADVLAVSRLSPEKGMDILVEATREIRDRHGEKIRLRIVGSGTQKPELEQLVRKYDLQDQVHLDGYIPFGHELLVRYANAKLMAIPSRTEGVPKSATEAMALGCPVVATNVGGLPEVVGDDGSKGVLVPPEDPVALADAIWRLLQDQDRRDAMAKNARECGLQYTLERQVEVIAKAFEDA